MLRLAPATAFKTRRERCVPSALLTVMLAVVHFQTAAAQTTPRISGYWEHQFSSSYNGGTWTQLDYDRFRADVSARAGRSTSASAGMVWQLYRGNRRISVNSYLPTAYRSALLDTTYFTLEDRHFLNHAYFTIKPRPFEVTVGKQYLTWGSAWTFNPTELFRPKNVFEPSYEREGVGALSVRLPLGALSNIVAAYVPDGGFGTSAKVLRGRSHVSGFDIAALVGELHEPTSPADFGQPAPESERRRVIGADLTGELAGLGVWAEGAWSERGGARWVELTVGGNYTLTDRTLLMVEGYYNGRGEWSDTYAIERWLARIYGVDRTLGKVTIYGLFSRPIGELLTVAASAIANVRDGSSAVIPAVTYAFAENVDLVMNLVFSIGPDGSEYGSGGQGGFVRGRVYF